MENRVKFFLPDAKCERMTRTEMNAFKLLVTSVSEINYGRGYLARQLSIIPDGEKRFDELMVKANELFEDMIGTVHSKQAKSLLNTVTDNEIRLMPKMAPSEMVVPVRKNDFQDLVSCAQEKCKFCTEDARTCENCKLYQILLAQVPLDDYGDGINCPYAYREWEN